MTKYYRVTAVLHEDEYEFVKRVSEMMQCSIAKAVSVCIVWARNNKSFTALLDELEKAKERRRDEQCGNS